jgi:outer membrane protein assembly factor BamB
MQNKLNGINCGCRIAAALLMIFSCVASSGAEDWPQFRGANGTGTTLETNLPATWDQSTNIAWRTALPGRGWSSPIVWGDRIFITTAVSDEPLETPKKGLYFGGNRAKPRDCIHRWLLICLDKQSGKKLWQKTCAEEVPKTAIHLKNSYASETPTTDGERVYAYFGALGIFCFDFSGNPIWEKRIDPMDTCYGWGTGSSPLLDDAHVYIQSDNDHTSFLLALDKKTGAEVWRVDRQEKSAWSSPFLWQTSQHTELITVASECARAYDPATGKQIWSLKGNSTIVCPTPIASKELLYVSSGYVMDKHRPIYAIKTESTGELSAESVAWHNKSAGPYNPSPLLYDGRIYVLYDRGFFGCLDAATGEEIYEMQRIQGNRAGFTSSPWAYDGKVFCLNEDGACFVFQAGDEFEQLHKNSLDEMCMASPAISDGYLFIRTDEHLYAIRGNQPVEPHVNKSE